MEKRMHSTWSFLALTSCSLCTAKTLVEQMLILKSVGVRWPLSAMTNLMPQNKEVNISELV
jgi:hypothetical protein